MMMMIWGAIRAIFIICAGSLINHRDLINRFDKRNGAGIGGQSEGRNSIPSSS